MSALALVMFIGPTWANHELLAQSAAAVSGIVSSPDRRPIASARVTLSLPGGGTAYESTTSLSGAFNFAIVRPGEYELRVEALGYRPLVVVGLGLTAGASRNLTLPLTVDPPPVTQVDTIRAAGVQGVSGQAGMRRLGELEVQDVPHRFDDLASVVSASTQFDESLGALGLPSDQTLVVADGVPFYRAQHPTLLAAAIPTPLFNRTTVAEAVLLTDGGAIDIPGSTGAIVSLTTPSAGATQSLEAGANFSNDAGWSSSRHSFDTPGLTSWQGHARGDVVLSPSSRMLVTGEAMNQETPLPPRIGDMMAADLVGLDPELITDLMSPSVERYTRYSSLLRVDAQQGQDGQFFGRLGGSWVKRDVGALGSATTSGAPALGEESLDFSAAFGHIAEVGRDLRSDVRAGFSGSRRDFTSGRDGLAPTTILSGASPIGAPAYSGGSSDRLDFVVIPSLRLEQESGNATAGVSIRLSKHEMEQSGVDAREYFYSDAAALLAGRGLAMETEYPATAFGTREYSAFVAYESLVSPGLTVTLGARFDHEALGGPGVPQNDDWLAASGLNTTTYKSSFNQIGLRGSVAWEPVPGGGTSLLMSGALRDGDIDPRIVHSLYGGAGAGASGRYLGTELDWPEPSIPSTVELRTVLAMLGPETRAPRTGLATMVLRQEIAPEIAMTLGGSYRRTDFLMRSRDLNLSLSPAALDPDGRPIWGTLSQDGSLVGSTDVGRRFGGFDRVSALDPSGWSEYMGATVGIDHSGTTASIAGSYTWSETTDNWKGARSGSMAAMLPSQLTMDSDAPDWSEGVSDFDATHRAAVAATFRAGIASLGALYRFRSGLPFTPGYRAGVDINADGSGRNDVARIPDAATLGSLATTWSCLGTSGEFAVRNSCRGPSSHSLNLRVEFDLSNLLGQRAALVVDALDVIETRDGIVDDALLLVDPTGSISTSPDGSTVTVPTIVNEAFGSILYPTSRGRMIRIGVRIGS